MVGQEPLNPNLCHKQVLFWLDVGRLKQVLGTSESLQAVFRRNITFLTQGRASFKELRIFLYGMVGAQKSLHRLLFFAWWI